MIETRTFLLYHACCIQVCNSGAFVRECPREREINQEKNREREREAREEKERERRKRE